MSTRRSFTTLLIVALAGPAAAAGAQQPQPQLAPQLREAYRLDAEGRTSDARAILLQVADTASTTRARAAANRAIAMSYAFDGDCENTLKYEDMVIDFWRTREAEEPQNAFFQEGEVANEAARVCIDAGSLATAERYYRLGTELGGKEPEPRTHPLSLWNFRLAHALARLAARRGDAAAAAQQVQVARRTLDDDPKMAAAQERFFPYLTGYVALYTGDLQRAEADLTRGLAIQGNTNDPFMHALLAETYEKLGNPARAQEMYRKAYDLATAHNPPSAYARRVARAKLGIRE